MNGLRLDQALARLLPNYSRNRIKGWIESGRVRLDEALPRPRDPVHEGQIVQVNPNLEVQQHDSPQAIELDVRFEDENLLVINKPPGLVVHPAAGNPSGTLLNALLHHAPDLASLPRAGIVHRLDKDTSGLMVIAKTPLAHRRLVAALAEHTVSRHYLALVQGQVISGGTVDLPLGRHPRDRKRIAVITTGKPAITHYRIAERYPSHTLLRVRLETGRTHQIRVHMAHIRHPIVGDPVYGGRFRLPAGVNEGVKELLKGFRRQALHATRLELQHPLSTEWISWEVQPPADMQILCGMLRNSKANNG